MEKQPNGAPACVAAGGENQSRCRRRTSQPGAASGWEALCSTCRKALSSAAATSTPWRLSASASTPSHAAARARVNCSAACHPVFQGSASNACKDSTDARPSESSSAAAPKRSGPSLTNPSGPTPGGNDEKRGMACTERLDREGAHIAIASNMSVLTRNRVSSCKPACSASHSLIWLRISTRIAVDFLESHHLVTAARMADEPGGNVGRHRLARLVVADIALRTSKSQRQLCLRFPQTLPDRTNCIHARIVVALCLFRNSATTLTARVVALMFCHAHF